MSIVPAVSSTPRSAAAGAARVLGLTLLYAAASALGLLAATQSGNVSPLWPATGVALCMVWRAGPIALVAVALGTVLTTMFTAAHPAAIAGMALATTLEAGLAVGLLRRARGFLASLGRTSDVFAFTVAAVAASTAAGALAGVASLCAAGDAPWERFVPLARTWWVGDALGNLVVGSALLVWTEPGPRWPRAGRRVEFAALIASAAIVTAIAFGGDWLPVPMLTARFLAIPAVAWAALRFGQRETALTTMIVSAVAILVTLVSSGEETPTERLIVAQLFIGVFALTGLFVAAVIASSRAAQSGLRDALSLLQATLDSTADGILVVDAVGRIRTWNRRFEQMWRLQDEVLQTRDDRRAIAAALDQLRDPGSFVAKVEELYARPEAESFDVLELRDGRTFERYSLPQREAGRIAGRVWSFRDVTPQRRLEAEVREVHKMEAVGRLAGGIAHEFNNLLTVVLGHAQLLAGQFEDRPAARRSLDEIRRASERAASLTRQLLAFGRKQHLEPRVLDLNAVVAETASMLRPLIGETIELTCDLSPGLGAVRADPAQIQQALLNLALNGRDAMPAGGRLNLRTYGHQLVVDDFARSLGLPPGPYVVLAVSDTGVGMDAATRAHLFEPFFTTKSRGERAGLGLAMVHGIVKQSGGEIRVLSEPGAGSQFEIYLPQVGERVAAHDEAPPARADLARGRGSVLLVEDSPSVRSLMTEALERAGYTVIEADNGRHALERVSATAVVIDLLVTDVVMPEMGGAELRRTLRERFPRVRALFVSGYPDEERMHRDIGRDGDAYLQKPFSPAALAQKVRELLSE
jgi:two-component system cell cycle sensor histidine kinase/response regulator CckA